MLKGLGCLLVFFSNLVFALQMPEASDNTDPGMGFDSSMNMIEQLEGHSGFLDSPGDLSKEVNGTQKADNDYLQQLKQDHETNLIEAQTEEAVADFDYGQKARTSAQSHTAGSGVGNSNDLIKQSLEAMGMKQQVKNILEDTKDFRDSIGISKKNVHEEGNDTYLVRESVYEKKTLGVNAVSDVSSSAVATSDLAYDEFSLWEFLDSIKWKLAGILTFILFFRLFIKLVLRSSRRKHHYRRL